MAARTGKCINFGACSKADAKEVVALGAGEEFVCPECGRPLQATEAGSGSGSSKKKLVLGASALLVIVAAAAWTFWPRNRQYPQEPLIPGPLAGGTNQEPKAPVQPPDTCALKPVDQPDVNRLLTYLKQGMTYASQRRYDLALKEFAQVQEIDPNFLAMHENVAAAQLKLRNVPEAERHLQQELKLIGCLEQQTDTVLPKFAYMLEVGHRDASEADAARASIMRERLKQAAAVAHYDLACVRARQGAADGAVAELREAVGKGFSDVDAIKRDPDLASVRSSPGFRDVIAAASAAKRNSE